MGVIMADVSGKGMPAALFMMRALADLREQMHSHPGDVGDALTRANKALCENNESMLFVTAFIGILDVETGLFAYANAGHNPAWQLGPDGTWLKARKGLMLGVMDMISYRTETLCGAVRWRPLPDGTMPDEPMHENLGRSAFTNVAAGRTNAERAPFGPCTEARSRIGSTTNEKAIRTTAT